MKNIHFIWAGGTFPMQHEGIEAVSGWAVNNPDHVVNLWIDEKTAGSLEELRKYYTDAFQDKGVRVVLEDDYQEDIPGPVVVLKDIGKSGLRDEHVAYEIEKLRPNYGASSDLLRYQILARYGGAYVDSDVLSGERPLSSIESESDRNFLYIEHCPQQPDASSEKLQTLSLAEVGNDTFICSPHHPLMEELAKVSRQNYSVGSPDDMSRIVSLAHSGRHIQDLTVTRTGPVCVQQLLRRGGYCRVAEGKWLDRDDNPIFRVRDGITPSLVSPVRNTGFWLKDKLRRGLSFEEALQAAKGTIEFELNTQHCVRLDDHIEDIIASCQPKSVSVEMVLSGLDPFLRESPRTEKIKFIQITGRYPETVDFCSRHPSPSLYRLNAESVCLALDYQLDLGKLIRVEMKAEEFARDPAKVPPPLEPNKTAKYYASAILSSQSHGTKERLKQDITTGIQTIEHLAQHIDRFDLRDQAQIRQYLQKRLEKYSDHCEALGMKDGPGIIQTINAKMDVAEVRAQVDPHEPVVDAANSEEKAPNIDEI